MPFCPAGGRGRRVRRSSPQNEFEDHKTLASSDKTARRVERSFIVPCQPIIARTVPTGDGWLHELKHDGYRIVAFKEGDKVRLWSTAPSFRIGRRGGSRWSGATVTNPRAVNYALPLATEELRLPKGSAMALPACIAQAVLLGSTEAR